MRVIEVRRKGRKEEGSKWKEESGVVGFAEKKHGYNIGRKKERRKGERREEMKTEKEEEYSEYPNPNFSKEEEDSSRRKQWVDF